MPKELMVWTELQRLEGKEDVGQMDTSYETCSLGWYLERHVSVHCQYGFLAQANILQLSALPPKFSFQKGLEANHNEFITRKVMGSLFMLLILYQIFTVKNNIYILASTSANLL